MHDPRKYRLTFTERLLGTCPPKDVYAKYILTRAPVPDDEDVLGELEMTVGGEENTSLVTSFHADADGIYLIDYQVKGYLKEAANILKEGLANAKANKSGIKNAKSKVDNYVFVFPRWIYLAEKADGKYARPLRAMTAQGPRTSIACSEFVEAGKAIEIDLDFVPGSEIGWQAIEQMLDYGKYKGIGQFRNGSFGRFMWERTG